MEDAGKRLQTVAQRGPPLEKFDCENDISEHSHEIVSYVLFYDAAHTGRRFAKSAAQQCNR